MAYTPIYTGTDLGAMGLDVAGAFMNQFVLQAATLAVLIIVALILGYMSGLFGKIGGLFKRFS